MDLVARQARAGRTRCCDALISAEYFDEMVAAIRMIAQQLAAELGKAHPG
jgi:hypothetical protein